jgi:hypothetical protein
VQAIALDVDRADDRSARVSGTTARRVSGSRSICRKRGSARTLHQDGLARRGSRADQAAAERKRTPTSGWALRPATAPARTTISLPSTSAMSTS